MVWDQETDAQHRRHREDADEQHICSPLQLGFIDRCVRLWSNPGELVLAPFAGIGSELYQAVKRGRRTVGIELKLSYWQTAVSNLTVLESQMAMPSLFELGATPRCLDISAGGLLAKGDSTSYSRLPYVLGGE